MNDILKVLGGAVVAIGIFLMGQGTALQDANFGASVGNIPTPYVASSTSFTLTTTSQRLLATSTQRISALVQATNCTAGAVYLNAQNDVVSVAGNGPVVMASSTLALNSFPDTPVPTGSVQGITNTGTCTVIVTEWRKQP